MRHGTRLLVWTLLGACVQTPPPESVEETEPSTPLRISDLWEGAVDLGGVATVEEVVVISGRTVDGTRFFAQDAGGGLRSGLRVEMSDPMPFWPPPVGSVVTLKGPIWLYDGAPTLFLEKVSNAAWPGEEIEPVATAWSDEPLLTHSLVEGAGAVISTADPGGRVELDDGTWLRGDFGLGAPDYGASGEFTAVAAPDHEVMLRDLDDWTGSWEPSDPVDVSIADLQTGQLLDGSKVRVRGVLVATDWSSDGRWTLVQEVGGEGLWIDTEAFGTPAASPGEVGDFTGEVRSDGDGLRLRVWDPPIMRQSGTPSYGDELRDGQLGWWLAQGIGAADASGDRRTVDGWVLDNRFTDLGPLPDPALIRAVVQVTAAQDIRLAVLDWESDL